MLEGLSYSFHRDIRKRAHDGELLDKPSFFIRLRVDWLAAGHVHSLSRVWYDGFLAEMLRSVMEGIGHRENPTAESPGSKFPKHPGPGCCGVESAQARVNMPDWTPAISITSDDVALQDTRYVVHDMLLSFECSFKSKCLFRNRFVCSEDLRFVQIGTNIRPDE